MSIDADLSAFFTTDVTQVVSDQELFRRRLKIGGDAFRYLKNAENVHSAASSVLGGAGAAGIAYGSWFASIGVLGQIGLAAGLVATPLAPIAAVGAIGAGGMYLTQRFLKQTRKGVVEEIPAFINTPIDILGTTVLDIILPVLLKIAAADGELHAHERARIRGYLCDEWGFDANFIDGAISAEEGEIRAWSFDVLKNLIGGASKTGDIDISAFKTDLLGIAQEVANADGKMDTNEREAIDQLEVSLGLKKAIVVRRSFWHWVLTVMRLRPRN